MIKIISLFASRLKVSSVISRSSHREIGNPTLLQLKFKNKSKKDRKDQELIQSSTSPVQGYEMGK